jgi:hypothetical protein
MMAEWTTGTSASSNDIVWGTWVDCTSSSSTTSGGTVWENWTSGTSGTSGNITYKAPSRLVPPPETEEQRQARLIRERQREEELERARLEREEAQCKAEELLQENLDREQLGQFERTKWFFVIGQSGKRYRIRHGWAGNVDELNDEGAVVAKYCIHPQQHVPIADSMLIQKLMLEADEQRFVQIANKTTLRVPRPVTV